MENIFFLVLVGVVGLLRVIFQTLEKKRNAEAQKRNAAPSSAVPVHPSGESEEERVRKFFEALGVPPSSAAPQPRPAREIKPKAQAPRRTILPVDPFPVPRGGPPLPPLVVVQPEAKEIAPPPRAATPPPPIPAPLPVMNAKGSFAVDQLEETAQVKDNGGESWAARLATRQGVRDALVLHEIFGPPRGLRSMEVQSFG